MEKEPGCFFCGEEATDSCSQCDWGKYCLEHKPLHKDQHGNCFPFKVANVAGKGNCLIAARDVSPGETILQDEAALMSASTTALVCLECLSPISDPSSVCVACGLPLCCAGPRHQPECRLLAGGAHHNLPPIDLISSLYLTVSAIRLLYLRQADPVRWGLVSRLMDHLEDRRNVPSWADTIHTIVANVKDRGADVSEEEVERAVGVLLTNAVSCHPVDGVDRGHGLFPVFSVTSHSCVANTWRCVEDDVLTLRATVPVQRGNELTTSYKSPAIGSVSRRGHFPSTWFFHCSCRRCCDATELGTYMSALRCAACPGVLLPARPLDYQSDWSCSGCSRSMSAGEALHTAVMLYKVAVEAAGDVNRLEKIRNHFIKVLHPNHFILLQVCKDLAMLYGHAEGFELRSLSLERLELKTRLCQEYMAVMEVVEPGYSRGRGRMLEELAEAKMDQARRKMEEGSLEKLETVLEYREAIKLIEEAEKCNQFDTRLEQSKFKQRFKNVLV